MKCEFCKFEITGNTKYILMVLTMVGYEDKDFCSKKCLQDFLNKPSLLKKIFGKKNE